MDESKKKDFPKENYLLKLFFNLIFINHVLLFQKLFTIYFLLGYTMSGIGIQWTEGFNF